MDAVLRQQCALRSAAINLKPYQGLKQGASSRPRNRLNVSAAINLKPYQGLKPIA